MQANCAMPQATGCGFFTAVIRAALLAVLMVSSPAVAGDTPSLPHGSADCAPCREFDRVNTLVRDGMIERSAAREALARALSSLTELYKTVGPDAATRSGPVFPLSGYGLSAVGKGYRHGYVPRGYDFFDGNRHGGHPAVDIFIHDRNQDSRDDRTGQPVPVVSVTGGIVVSRATGWTPESGLRGGNYVWVYDPPAARLYYYAHLAEVAVEVGDVVRPGDRLGTVGRSGLNAAKRRSPTHLHFMVLSTKRGQFSPVYVYPEFTAL